MYQQKLNQSVLLMIEYPLLLQTVYHKYMWSLSLIDYQPSNIFFNWSFDNNLNFIDNIWTYMIQIFNEVQK